MVVGSVWIKWEEREWVFGEIMGKGKKWIKYPWIDSFLEKEQRKERLGMNDRL